MTKVEQAVPAIATKYRRYLRRDTSVIEEKVEAEKIYNLRGRKKEKSRGRPRKTAEKSKVSSRKRGRPRKYEEGIEGENRGIESSKIR
jgi:hypothetical protein